MAMRENGRRGGLCDRVDSLDSATSAGKFDSSPSFFFFNFFSIAEIPWFFHCWGLFHEFDFSKVNISKVVENGFKTWFTTVILAKMSKFLGCLQRDCNCSCMELHVIFVHNLSQYEVTRPQLWPHGSAWVIFIHNFP